MKSLNRHCGFLQGWPIYRKELGEKINRKLRGRKRFQKRLLEGSREEKPKSHDIFSRSRGARNCVLRVTSDHRATRKGRKPHHTTCAGKEARKHLILCPHNQILRGQDKRNEKGTEGGKTKRKVRRTQVLLVILSQTNRGGKTEKPN